MTDEMSDEEFIWEIAQHSPQAVEDMLAEAYPDGNIPPYTVSMLDAAGFELEGAEPEYEDEAAYEPADELSQRLDAMEQYLAETPAEQIWPAQGYEYEPSEEEATELIVDHLAGEMDALEHQLGRELTEAEVTRTTQSVIDMAEGLGELPAVTDAFEAARYDHEEATDSHAGRTETMTRAIEEQNYQEPSQEDVDQLAEKDDNASRTQLMMHGLDGTVSLNGGSETEPWAEE